MGEDVELDDVESIDTSSSNNNNNNNDGDPSSSEDEDLDDVLDLEDLEELQQSKVATPTCCLISGLVALVVGILCFGLSLLTYLFDKNISNKPEDIRVVSIVIVSLGAIPLAISVLLIGASIYIWFVNRNEYARVKTMIELQKKEALV